MILDNFCCIGAELQNKEVSNYKAPQLFYYRSANSSETMEIMLSAGFFNDLYQRINIGDLMLVYEPMTKKIQWIKFTSNLGGVVGFERIASSVITAEEVPVIPTEPFISTNLQALSTEIINKLADMQQDIDGKLTAEDATLTGTTNIENAIVSGDMTATDITGEKLVINTEATIENTTLNGDTTIVDAMITDATIDSLIVSSSINVPTPTNDNDAATKKYVDEHSATGGYTPSLLTFQWSDHLLNDMQWLMSNGSWQDGTTYSNAYNHLLEDIDGITPEYDEYGDIIIEYYKSVDGHKICLANEEENVSNLYNTTGIAWYFIVDTENARFKLPRTQFGFAGIRDEVGKFIPETLPNIKGSATVKNGVGTAGDGNAGFGDVEGAFKLGKSFSAGRVLATSSTTRNINQVDFDANESSSVYQDNAPVQQKSTQMYLYFYVGEHIQEAIEQTAGLNAELFNNKADRDLNNISEAAKQIIRNINFVDYDNYIDITLPTNGETLEMPADGELNWAARFSSRDGYISTELVKNGVRWNKNQSSSGYANFYAGFTIKVQKGDIIRFYYSNIAEILHCRLFKYKV